MSMESKFPRERLRIYEFFRSLERGNQVNDRALPGSITWVSADEWNWGARSAIPCKLSYHGVAFYVWALTCKSTGINVCARDMGIEKGNFVIFSGRIRMAFAAGTALMESVPSRNNHFDFDRYVRT